MDCRYCFVFVYGFCIMRVDGGIALDYLLRVEELKTWFGSLDDPIRAVDGVSLDIPLGSTVALVGESGCGKSVTALSLARLLPSPPAIYAAGRIMLGERDILQLSSDELLRVRGGEIAYVFQEPSTALNPVLRLGRQIMEGIRVHRRDVDAEEEAVALMETVGLPDARQLMRRYPHQISGGMQQRVVIAMALDCRPRLLVADEPTTALDVTVQAQILELLASLQKQSEMSVLLITHNLGLVAGFAEHVSVMYAGRIVESGPVQEVLSSPAHPYTAALLSAVPRMGWGKAGENVDVRIAGIPGTVPHPGNLPGGCKFAPRCGIATADCHECEPPFERIESGRGVRCWKRGTRESGSENARAGIDGSGDSDC